MYLTDGQKAFSVFKTNVAVAGDRIKGLKLRRINAYCGSAAVDKPQKTRDFLSPSSTVAAIYGCYGHSRQDVLFGGGTVVSFVKKRAT